MTTITQLSLIFLSSKSDFVSQCMVDTTLCTPGGSPNKDRTSTANPFDFTPPSHTPSFSSFSITARVTLRYDRPVLILEQSALLICSGQSVTSGKRKRAFDRSGSESTTSSSPKSMKCVRRESHSSPAAESGLASVVVDLMQQEFRRRSSFEDRMVELSLQKLEETRAMRREIVCFIRECRRRSRTL